MENPRSRSKSVEFSVVIKYVIYKRMDKAKRKEKRQQIWRLRDEPNKQRTHQHNDQFQMHSVFRAHHRSIVCIFSTISMRKRQSARTYAFLTTMTTTMTTTKGCRTKCRNKRAKSLKIELYSLFATRLDTILPRASVCVLVHKCMHTNACVVSRHTVNPHNEQNF